MNEHDKLTAEEARTRYKPPYTLQAILDHITRNCAFSQEIYGYEVDRVPQEVWQELKRLGYILKTYTDFNKNTICYTISWRENELSEDEFYHKKTEWHNRILNK